MRMSFSSDDAPKRNQSGLIQRGPSVSYRTTRYWIASFATRIPPAGFIATCLVLEIADRLEHDQTHRQRRRRDDLAGRGLDEVGARSHGQHRGPPDVVIGLELAGLEDHLEMGVAAGVLD